MTVMFGASVREWAGLRLQACHVVDGSSKSVRGFLRKIVPDAPSRGSVLVFPSELAGVGAGVRVWCAIRITLEGNRGHRDRG